MKIIKFENNEIFAKTFRSSFIRRNIVPIIGAGFTNGENTVNSKVPDGKKFREIMKKEICKHYPDIKEEDFENEGYKFSEIANEFFKRVPSDIYKKILKERFTKVRLSASKKNFLKINWPYIFTLNIDDAIEKNSQYEAVRPYRKLSNDCSELNCVYKMHGDVYEELTYDEPPNVIFSQEQYIKSLEANSSILNFFQSDYSSKNIIFIGCSLEDELDLKYAISTSTSEKLSNIERIFITGNEPTGLRRSRLEDFGISLVLLLDDYNEFYDFLFEIYDNIRFDEEKPFEIFKNPKIDICDIGSTHNKEFLLDVAGAKSAERILPFFTCDRDLISEIIKVVDNETVTVICGKRFSGKTFCAKNLAKQLQKRDVYYFPSNISLGKADIADISKIEDSYVIFDTNSINISSSEAIGSLIDIFVKKNTKLILFVNKSDSILNSIVSRLTNNNYFHLNNKFSDRESSLLNKRLSRIGLIKYKNSCTLIDNCYRAFKLYKKEVPFDTKKITDKEFLTTIILASDGKVYSVIFNLLEITKQQVDKYINKLSPFIEYQEVDRLEQHQHSGFKVVSNSSSWLFRILSEYKDDYGHNKVAEGVKQVVGLLIENQAYSYLYKKIITFDNLNQLFSGEERGEAGLILNIYEKLEELLYDDNHFWLQRAKSIRNLKRHSIKDLKLATDFAKKAFYDTTKDQLQVNATSTLALLYTRIINLQRYVDHTDVKEAINWTYGALQKTQLNTHYRQDILRKAKLPESDIINLCKFLLHNTVQLNREETKQAEFIVNLVVMS